MAELTTVARPYAKAAYAAAQSQNALADWSAMLGFSAAVAADQNMKTVLDHPSLTSEKKAETFISVCEGKMSEQGQNFISVLADNKRLTLLPEIAALFELYKAQQERAVDVEVESAFELSAEQQEQLAQALTKKLDRKVNISSTTNSELLGGVIMRAEDLVIDGSVRGKLAKLAEAINS